MGKLEARRAMERDGPRESRHRIREETPPRFPMGISAGSTAETRRGRAPTMESTPPLITASRKERPGLQSQSAKEKTRRPMRDDTAAPCESRAAHTLREARPTGKQSPPRGDTYGQKHAARETADTGVRAEPDHWKAGSTHGKRCRDAAPTRDAPPRCQRRKSWKHMEAAPVTATTARRIHGRASRKEDRHAAKHAESPARFPQQRKKRAAR